MLSEIKNLDVRRADMEELVEVAAFGRALEAEFNALGVVAPEWLEVNLTSLRREIKSRNEDAKAAKLKSLKARLETLKTPDEKRKSIEDEIARLEQEVNS